MMVCCQLGNFNGADCSTQGTWTEFAGGGIPVTMQLFLSLTTLSLPTDLENPRVFRK
jgi:hypothetical protein